MIRSVLLFLCVVCFLGAACNHTRDLWSNGWLTYGECPHVFHVFWTALAFVDPIVVVLIAFKRIRAAVALAIGIMVSDVVVITWFAYM